MVASQPAAVVCALYAVIEGLEFRPPTICKHQGASMLKKPGGLTWTSTR